MKKALWFITLSSLVLADVDAERLPCNGLAPQTAEKIRFLADNEKPDLRIAFLPEAANTVIPLPNDKNVLRQEAVTWIRRVVAPRWLPPGFEGKITAMKDVKLWEKKDANGFLISELVGDFLCLNYELNGRKFHLYESGETIAFRVDFLESKTVNGSLSEENVIKMLSEFINLPIQAEVRVTHIPSLYVVASVGNTKIAKTEWWNTIYACTDGTFLFVNVLESDPASATRYARPGLPDRF